MRETDGVAGRRGCWLIRAENGRFPGGRARPADRRRNPPENPLRLRRQTGGTHLVHEFLRTALVQVAPQQPADLGGLGVELLDQAACSGRS
jgi:hypothetical protein